MGLLIHRAEVAGYPRPVDVRADDGRIVAVAPALPPRSDDEVIDADGGALVPGLVDHHVHLMAWAAALDSIPCGPPTVWTHEELARALREGSPLADSWIRGVGYHESVAGYLDRAAIDDLESDRPVRIQHRSGMLWMLNSAAIRRLDLDNGGGPPGVERDVHGRPTGRCWYTDSWLRDRLPRRPMDLGRVGRRLAGYGVTAVTDATATTDAEAVRALERAAVAGKLPQRITVMGPVGLEVSEHGPLQLGPVKIMLHEPSLPDLDETVGLVIEAHAADRAVAFHCTTRVELVFALAALEDAGCGGGDRIEHGGVIPPGLRPSLCTRGLTVITQPNFVAERGDDYLRDVDQTDLPHLYPCAGLLAGGIRVAAGTDAPFGGGDPWRAIDAAQRRRTRSGRAVGSQERIDGLTALGLFLGSPRDPGGAPCALAPGAPADLCVLRVPVSVAIAEPDASNVTVTVVAGEIVHTR